MAFNMESKFRPLPLSLLDLTAIMTPGMLWVVALCFMVSLIQDSGWFGDLSWKLGDISSWLFGVAGPWARVMEFSLLSVILGFGQKPVAMWLGGKLVLCLRRFWPGHFSRGAELKHPFRALHSKFAYYERLRKELGEQLGMSPQLVSKLPGAAPFSAAKRYLRLRAAPLWEECERIEAEVRLLGGVFCATAFLELLCIAWFLHSGLPPI